MNQLTFLSLEPLTSPSVSPESEADWMIRAVNWCGNFFALQMNSNQDGSFGKTSLVHCRQTAEKTLEPSSERWCNSGMASATESWTLNTSECPNDAVESSLWDILETGAVPCFNCIRSIQEKVAFVNTYYKKFFLCLVTPFHILTIETVKAWKKYL